MEKREQAIQKVAEEIRAGMVVDLLDATGEIVARADSHACDGYAGICGVHPHATNTYSWSTYYSRAASRKFGWGDNNVCRERGDGETPGAAASALAEALKRAGLDIEDLRVNPFPPEELEEEAV